MICFLEFNIRKYTVLEGSWSCGRVVILKDASFIVI